MRSTVVDSGSTARTVSRWLAVDSGGTTRLIQRGFVIDSGGTARQIHTNDVVSLIGGTYGEVAPSPGTASGFYRLTSGGKEEGGNSGGTDSSTDWVVPNGSAGNYEVRATVDSGSLDGSSSATGSWLALTSTRTWNVACIALDPFGAQQSATLTIEVRRASDSTIVATTSVSLDAICTV